MKSAFLAAAVLALAATAANAQSYGYGSNSYPSQNYGSSYVYVPPAKPYVPPYHAPPKRNYYYGSGSGYTGGSTGQYSGAHSY